MESPTLDPRRPLSHLLPGLCLLSFVPLFFGGHAAAQTFGSWTPIYQGIDFASGSETSPNSEQLYAVRIALNTAGLSFETTTSSPTAVSQGFETFSQTTGDFLTSV